MVEVTADLPTQSSLLPPDSGKTINYIKNSAVEHGLKKDYLERQNYWTSFMKDLRDAEKRGEISEEEGDYLRGSLVASKEYLASHDTLSELCNRRELESRFSSAIAHCKRTGEPLCVLMADADRFKSVNDTLGHEAGDDVIRAISYLMKINFREDDVLARTGGDEFAAILTNTNAEGGEKAGIRLLMMLRDKSVIDLIIMARAIRKGIKESEVKLNEAELIEANKTREEQLSVGLSLGLVSVNTEVSEDLSYYLKRADEGLYEAKKTGKDRLIRVK